MIRVALPTIHGNILLLLFRFHSLALSMCVCTVQCTKIVRSLVFVVGRTCCAVYIVYVAPMVSLFVVSISGNFSTAHNCSLVVQTRTFSPCLSFTTLLRRRRHRLCRDAARAIYQSLYSWLSHKHKTAPLLHLLNLFDIECIVLNSV